MMDSWHALEKNSPFHVLIMLDKSMATLRFFSFLERHYPIDEIGLNQGMRGATVTEGSAQYESTE